jgi:type IV pilus assembly protein PilE
MKKSPGFTLTELLITLLLAGILMAVALPSYRNFVLKSHRTEARSTLLDIAARQERFVAQHNRYSLDLVSSNELNLGRTTSQEGYYTLSITPGATLSINTSYLITATAIGNQIRDSHCLEFTYDSLGTKSSSPSLNCW